MINRKYQQVAGSYPRGKRLLRGGVEAWVYLLVGGGE